MKSEKALKMILKDCAVPAVVSINDTPETLISLSVAKRAVEVAEDEAEQRVREELATWHYTKDRLPDEGRLVNAIIGVYDNDLRVIIAHYDLFGWWMCPTPTEAWASCPYDIIKWRYIQ